MRKMIAIGCLAAALSVSLPLGAAFQEAPEVTQQEEVIKTERVPYGVKYAFDRNLGAGRIKKVKSGIDGSVVTTQVSTLIAGKVVKTEQRVDKTAAVDAVFHMGKSGFSTDRGSLSRKSVMTMEASAYTIAEGSGTGRTATGRKATYGVVAVDPKVIPLNTLVFVEGYGFAIAADTGGAIKGKKIDLCMTSRQKAIQFGRRDVVVHVFNESHGKSRNSR